MIHHSLNGLTPDPAATVHCPPVKGMHKDGSKITNILSSISLIICFVCSKEPSQRDISFEYPQHMFLLRNKKIKLIDFSCKITNILSSVSLTVQFNHLFCVLKRTVSSGSLF